MQKSLAHRIEISWLESERYLDHIRYFELRTEVSSARSAAFAKCRRIERNSEILKDFARMINAPVKMQVVRILARNGDDLSLEEIEKKCKILSADCRWYHLITRLTSGFQ